MKDELAIEGAKAISHTVKGSLFTGASVGGGIITFIAENSAAITPIISFFSAIVGALYFYNSIKLQRREQDRKDRLAEIDLSKRLNDMISERTKSAPKSDREILDKYF